MVCHKNVPIQKQNIYSLYWDKSILPISTLIWCLFRFLWAPKLNLNGECRFCNLSIVLTNQILQIFHCSEHFICMYANLCLLFIIWGFKSSCVCIFRCNLNSAASILPHFGFCLAEHTDLNEPCVYRQPLIKEVLSIILQNEDAYLLPVLYTISTYCLCTVFK